MHKDRNEYSLIEKQKRDKKLLKKKNISKNNEEMNLLSIDQQIELFADIIIYQLLNESSIKDGE